MSVPLNVGRAERNRHGGLKQFVINFRVEKLKKANFFLLLFRLFFAFSPSRSAAFPLPLAVSMPLGIYLIRKVIVVFFLLLLFFMLLLLLLLCVLPH